MLIGEFPSKFGAQKIVKVQQNPQLKTLFFDFLTKCELREKINTAFPVEQNLVMVIFVS